MTGMRRGRDCFGLVQRGWAARSAVKRDDDHVPQSRGGTACPFNATASANARRGVPDRRITLRRRVLLWPPQPATSSIDDSCRALREWDRFYRFKAPYDRPWGRGGTTGNQPTEANVTTGVTP